jgi:hypothetical protein
MKPTIFAALVGAAAFVWPVAEANAAPVTPVPGLVLGSDSSLATPVAMGDRKRGMRRDWRRDRDGRRCSGRNGNCRHFHNGYWYETPWWTLPLIGGAIINESMRRDRGGSRHVEWCLDRYRSYNVRTNTWVAYSGDVRQCVSPYR